MPNQGNYGKMRGKARKRTRPDEQATGEYDEPDAFRLLQVNEGSATAAASRPRRLQIGYSMPVIWPIIEI